MGFYSWKTSDTKQSISNVESSKGALPCKMIMPNGKEFVEERYEGYGVFGGEDFYHALYLWNERNLIDKAVIESACSNDRRRSIGIAIYYYSKGYTKGNEIGALSKKIVLPKLVSIGCSKKYDELPESEQCPNQGFFYTHNDI